MLQKIRAALQHRDARYEVGDGVIELDAGTFGCRGTGNQGDVHWNETGHEVIARELYAKMREASSRSSFTVNRQERKK